MRSTRAPRPQPTAPSDARSDASAGGAPAAHVPRASSSSRRSARCARGGRRRARGRAGRLSRRREARGRGRRRGEARRRRDPRIRRASPWASAPTSRGGGSPSTATRSPRRSGGLRRAPRARGRGRRAPRLRALTRPDVRRGVSLGARRRELGARSDANRRQTSSWRPSRRADGNRAASCRGPICRRTFRASRRRRRWEAREHAAARRRRARDRRGTDRRRRRTGRPRRRDRRARRPRTGARPSTPSGRHASPSRAASTAPHGAPRPAGVGLRRAVRTTAPGRRPGATSPTRRRPRTVGAGVGGRS